MSEEIKPAYGLVQINITNQAEFMERYAQHVFPILAKWGIEMIAGSDAPVTKDTSVNYQLSGTAQNGADYRALSGTVIMKAGSSSVTVPINVINDDVIFKPSDMLVADWPARIGKVEVDEGEFVLQGNVVLSLTEPQFTITMKVSPTDRAELEVGQAVSVDLKVGGQILPGVISELNDSANVGAAGEELYEGTITVTGDFSAVDGATVSIDVTLAEALQVLAVPVAAFRN